MLLSKKYKNWREFWSKNSYLTLILALASFLRLWQLGRRDFWYDEAFTGVAVKESFSGMMQMILKDVHPPLYYLALKSFSASFDYSVVGIRLFSAIFGILNVYLVYLLAKKLFSRRAGLWSALIATISPFAIQYSQEGRMYSMFVFFILLATYFFVLALKEDIKTSYDEEGNRYKTLWKEYQYYLFFGFFLGLSALTHYIGLIFAPIFYAVFLVWSLGKGELLEQKVSLRGNSVFYGFDLLKRFLPSKGILFAYATSLLVFSPWIVNFKNHFIRTSNSNNLDWIRLANFGDIAVNLQMFIFGTPLGEMSSGMPGPNEFQGIAEISAWILVTVILTAIVTYLFLSKKKTKEILSVLLLSLGFMILVWFLGFFGKKFFVARYLLAGGYFTFILFGVWLTRLKLPFSILAVGGYLILLQTIVPLGYSTGWNKLAVNLNKYEGQNFYILNSFDYLIAKYYLGADRLTLYNVDWPPYNPDYWAGIGSSLKRTENFEDLKQDKKGYILSNVQLPKEKRPDQTFDPSGLELVDQYDNILVYRFK